MKSKLTKIIFLFAISLSSANAQVDLSSGLKLYFPFTGNAYDSSGNGSNGTVNNATLTTDRCGKANSAYYFNGTNAYISFPTDDVLNNQYSFSLWAKPAEIPATGSYTYPFSIGVGNSGQNIALCNNSMQGWAGGSYNSGTPVLSLVATGEQPETNQWYHIVLVRNSSKIKLYVNGVLNTNEVYYGSYNQDHSGNSADYGSSPIGLIGNRNFNNSLYFKGKIDDIRVYDRVVNDDEIDSLFREKNCNNLSVQIVSGKKQDVNIYPNPGSGLFNIDLGIEHSYNSLKVFNSLGQVVSEKTLSEDSLSTTSIDLSSFESGVYQVVLYSVSGQLSKSILLNR